ncbi:hypothetical protein EZZ75_02370 [Neisseria meningitidis]|nr:hypothetical protein [Neisseria meningitidis]
MNRHSHKDIKPKQETKNSNPKYFKIAVLSESNCIGSNRIRSAIIPTKVGIRKPNHSHVRGNLIMKSNRHLAEITETERTRFPLLRE